MCGHPVLTKCTDNRHLACATSHMVLYIVDFLIVQPVFYPNPGDISSSNLLVKNMFAVVDLLLLGS